jgi:GT2 family glycosyltransferase
VTASPHLPSISVVMPTYDEPERLQTALRSLSSQEYPPRKVEIVVIDDASPQPPSEGLGNLVQPFSLRLIRQVANQGRARARNAGLRAAQGELIVFLDSDMTVESNFLRAHADQHRGHPRTVGIGHISFGPNIPSDALTGYIESRGVHRLAPSETVPFKCFVTGNSSVRRDLLLEVGMFDEDFTAYGGEDLELGYRLHKQGVTFCYLPQAVSWHHHLRSLDQLCQLMHIYGRHSLPLLTTKHPELAGLLRLGFLERRLLSPRRLLMSLALCGCVYRPVLSLSRWNLNRRVPDLFFDYLWWYHRTRGFLDAVDRENGTCQTH